MCWALKNKRANQATNGSDLATLQRLSLTLPQPSILAVTDHTDMDVWSLKLFGGMGLASTPPPHIFVETATTSSYDRVISRENKRKCFSF